VDQIDGLSPAISIDQKSTSRNPRSTVATVTEIYDYLRLLFARIGVAHCPIDGRVVERRTAASIIEQISALPSARLLLLAPVVTDKKGAFEHIPDEYTRAGFARARVNGVVYALDEWPALDKNKKHNIEIIVDRLVNDAESRTRLAQSIEQALEVGSGRVIAVNADTKEEFSYNQAYACPDHPDINIPELEPRTFSFNNPHGACPVCTGIGSRMEVDPELVIPNGKLTIAEGAIRPYNRVNIDNWYMKKLLAVGERYGFDLKTPTGEISKQNLDKILYGTDSETYRISLGMGRGFETTYEGVIPNLERRYHETESDFIRRDIERFMQERPCYLCQGLRLKAEVLAVTVHGKSIMDICQGSIDEVLGWFDELELSEQEEHIASQILKEIKARLGFMQDVGLNYLSLLRSATTLSGGEAQRIRLATQIGSGLMGVLYVLDEPSIGLHQRDNARLLKTLKHLRDLGNTVVVVEHDEETIREADYLIDIGPGAGAHGGKVVAEGTPAEVEKTTGSVTADYLAGRLKIAVPKKRRAGNGNFLKVVNA
ncbi:MAG: excinuclease ABC subunit UvrA, partial [Candidatus Saccharimonadales bacterium]